MDQLFTIFKYNPEEAAKLHTDKEGLHTHDFEELLIGLKGGMHHFIDFESAFYEAPFISFVTKGKLHKLDPVKQDGIFDVWVIGFRSEFIPETTFQLYAWYHDHANLTAQKDGRFDRMVKLCGMMHAEMTEPEPDLAVVRHLLNGLFTMIESVRKKSEPGDKTIYGTQNITFRNFLKILEENYRRPAGVDFYAEKLFMSARNLNIICQNILQKSVSEIIETRKLTEAKNLLIHTGKSISEIGYELGYNEKAYFTNVFRKKSGLTPTEFRNEMRMLIS